MQSSFRSLTPLALAALLALSLAPASAAPARDAKAKAPAKASTSRSEALVLAIMARDEKKALALLNAGVSPHAAPGLKDPLFTAAAFDLPNVAQLLLKKGAKPNLATGGFGDEAPLHVAARNGSWHVVPILIKGSANPNIMNGHRQTPLFLAATMGRPEVAAGLLDGGAKPNLADDEGVTPLMVAAAGMKAEGVRFAAGSVPGTKVEDLEKLTEGELKKRAEQISVELVGLLLKHGADPNLRDKEGMVAWHYARRQEQASVGALVIDALQKAGAKKPVPTLASAISTDSLAEFKEALAQGADPNGKSPDGSPYIMFLSALPDHREWVHALLEKGANPNVKVDGVGGPINFAAASDDLEAVRMLLDHKADPNVPGILGRTPVMGTGPAVTKLLLEHGARINDRDQIGHTALYYVEKPEVWAILLNSGADPNAKDIAGGTPLHFLASEAKFTDGPSLKLILEKGAKINGATKDGTTPLMVSCMQEGGKVTQLLLENGADPNARTTDGSTALIYAAENGNLDAVKALIAKRANVNAANKAGVTALKAVAGLQKVPAKAGIIQALKAAGATR